MLDIPLDVLVDALNALDLVRKDDAVPFDHVARCSIAAGQLQAYVAFPHGRLIEHAARTLRGVHSPNLDATVTCFKYMGVTITCEEFMACKKRLGISS
jgi:hypothetical protein